MKNSFMTEHGSNYAHLFKSDKWEETEDNNTRIKRVGMGDREIER